MTAQKRPLDFVHLAETAGQSARARFLMVGDGDLAPEVDRRVQGVEGGRLERWPFSDRVHEVLAMADGFIITSEYEGLPIAMLEALAMGVPVLTTDVGEIRVVLEELGAGLVVDPRKGNTALSEAFARFRGRLPEYRAAAVAAAPSLRQRFGGPTIAGQYDECWKKAAPEEGRAPAT
jgi:glycosyltransferase involved in cell wall biosynthesis